MVAQEVKTLASQTAKATAEITDQIAAIQRASHASAEALAAIQGKIAEVDRNSTAIALTADQQRSSTRLIASSIRATADHAKDMAQLAESLETRPPKRAPTAPRPSSPSSATSTPKPWPWAAKSSASSPASRWREARTAVIASEAKQPGEPGTKAPHRRTHDAQARPENVALTLPCLEAAARIGSSPQQGDRLSA